jgi:predicted membrane-bound spermidine synthase
MGNDNVSGLAEPNSGSLSKIEPLKPTRGRTTVWLLLMLSTGFCSMVYELALAQLLTGLLGNALARFATTLGVYVVGMGLGSVAFKAKNEELDSRLFFSAELALAAIGLMAPFIFVGSYRLSILSSQDPEIQSLIVLSLTHLVIFATGFFSGLELPILSAIANRSSTSGDANVLAADYVGMFLASVAFPFVLYPVFGLIPAFAVATSLNLVAAIVTYFFIQRRSVLLATLMTVFAVLNICAFVFSSQIQTWLSSIYVAGT